MGRNAQVQRSAQQCDAINHELSFSCSPYKECHLPHLPALRAPFHWLDLNAEHDQASSARPLRALTGFFTARKNNRTPTFSVPLSLVPGPKNERGLESRSSNQKNREAGKRASSCPNGSGRRRKARFRVPQVLSGCDGPAIALAIDRFALNLIGNSQPPVRGGRGTLLPLARRRRRSNTAYLSCLR